MAGDGKKGKGRKLVNLGPDFLKELNKRTGAVQKIASPMLGREVTANLLIIVALEELFRKDDSGILEAVKKFKAAQYGLKPFQEI
ncbi:MAG: hypothetical protein ACYS8W_07890 [Planctomycetota bacterium]|jgi:hypothetical protein